MQSTSQITSHSLRFDWIFGPGRDLLFFFLPVPLAFIMFEVARASELSNALLYGIIGLEATALGAFHQGATWFHFLDKENRAYYLSGVKGFLEFVLLPIILFAATILGEFYWAPVTFFIYMCWSLNHAVQQNIGILLLYQNSKTDEAKVSRTVQAWSQRWIAICFSLIFFKRTLLVETPLESIIFWPILCTALLGLGYCTMYILELSAQLVQGKHVNLSGFLFWLLCILYLVPFAFLGKDYNSALLIPLVVHWCQYIGINSVVAQRKYQGNLNSNLPVPNPLALYIASGSLVITIVLTLAYFRQGNGLELPAGRVLQGVILGLSMVHYYLDGFLWRFRDKFPREAMLPHLVRR